MKIQPNGGQLPAEKQQEVEEQEVKDLDPDTKKKALVAEDFGEEAAEEL